MSIQELSSKFKRFFINTEYQLAILVVFVSFISFILGRLSDGNLAAIDSITQNTENTAQIIGNSQVSEESVSQANNTETPTSIPESGKYVASKNGTKYHLPWCGGAKQIKEENKVWFETKEEAERAGYSPAANCKGI